MNRNNHPNTIVKPKFTPPIKAALAFLCALLCCLTTQAQTLQLRYTFEDGPGTTTTNDPASAIYPLVMNMISSSGAAVDLHGSANSGIQNVGASLNLSTNPPSGNSVGSFAQLTNSVALAALGTVTDFTASVWIKMPFLETNQVNNGSRIFALMGPGVTDIGGVNSIGFQPQLTSGATLLFPKLVMRGIVGNTFVTAPLYYDYPTNEWLFFALTYDSTSGNVCLYYGTEASPAKLYVVKGIGAGTNFNFSTAPSFTLGDRANKGRSFPGWIDDARFYTGAGNLSFIESVRQSSTPVIVAGLVPDGSVLQGGTNTLSFTATSANGIDPAGIKVKVNGADVSSGLSFTPTAGGQIVSYTQMPVNPTLIQQSNLNAVAVNIKVTDKSGIVTSNSYVYDAFSPTNFTWEGEDYDFGGGQFIDNPVMSFVGPAANTYYQIQQTHPLDPLNPTASYINTVDANDNGNSGGPSRIYRDPLENVETEYSIGGGANGGQSIGELMRQKVLDAYAVTNTARDVNVGYFDGGVGSGLPNWMNYTRTFPNGNYNIFLRVAYGGGTASTPMDKITDGWGTTTQTTTNLGTFNIANSGGWDSFAWVPLRDSGGNLVQVQLNGTNTLRLTAGGGNLNFAMLIPANTNLPSIGNIYPNGTNMFQPSPTLSFIVSSPAGVAISTNGVKVRLTVTNLLGQGFVTNLTATNGLVFTGNSTNWTVNAPLISNEVYTAAISLVDANGSPANTGVSFDTLSPVYTWEAEDYDYNSGQTFDTLTPGVYAGFSGVEGVDGHNNPDSGETFVYRTGLNADQVCNDAKRLQFITNSLPDYNLGWYDGGEWDNYTRTFPAGTFNVYMRGANGSTGSGVTLLDLVTSGVGTATQTTTNLGAMTISPTGDWQAYAWVPLRDSGGNLVKFTGGSLKTLRVTSGGSLNANFYALFPANTNLPALTGVFPVSGTQLTNTFSFGVQSSAGVSSNSVAVTVNGATVSNLVFAGTINNWTVTYPHLSPNSVYTITVMVTDGNGNSSATTVSFDTMDPRNYTWEAEDFDYNDVNGGGLFFDNPQTNAYAGLGALAGVDTVQVNFGGTYSYRTSGEDNGPSGDTPRPQYQDPSNPQVDGSIGFFSDGAWCNYTRHYPVGQYYVYGRFATAVAAGTDANLAEVTGGWGTTTQTTNLLGSFAIPDTGGWGTYQYVPLRDASGNLAMVTFNGSTNTLQLIRPVDVPASGDVNVNFLMLAPVFTTSASEVGTNLVVSFATLNGFKYQVQYKTNLTDPAWISVGSALPGNNAIQTVSDPIGAGTRFYRVQIQ
jgi:hypothetical protein